MRLVHCQEEDHEWGGPGTASILANKPVSMATLANAARRWRINIQQKQQVHRQFLRHLSPRYRTGPFAGCLKCNEIYPLFGIFYFPWHRHQIEGTTGFNVSSERHRQMWGERNCLSFEMAVGGIEPPSP